MGSCPALLIREVADADLARVLAINQQSIPAMNSLTEDDLLWFVREAEYFCVAECDRNAAGFLICLRPEALYGSPNLVWFNERYDDFLYVDRVAVAIEFQRRGVATALYKDAATRASPRFCAMACEVNTRPRNGESLQFHKRLGFKPVGTQDHGYVQVQYMLCPLPFGLADRRGTGAVQRRRDLAAGS